MNTAAFAKLPARRDRVSATAVRGWRASWRRLVDRIVARCSALPDEAVLDVRLLPWTAELRANWRTIRDEALACRAAFATPWAQGEWIAIDDERTPATAAILAGVPGIAAAGFSFLRAGAHLAERRGDTKALVTCQLGLVVPQEGDARMRIDGRIVRWADGETLVFDDTAPHEIWNDTACSRVVLLVRARRPLRQPACWIADRLLGR